MLKLTAYKTGFSVYVDREAIKSARQLPADAENSLRTRIDTATDTFIVQESVWWVMRVNQDSPTKQEPFAHQLCEMTVTFFWDGDNLGINWMNEDNLKILLYTDAWTKRDLLNCCVHGVNGTNTEISSS